MINGLIVPDQGNILVKGKDIQSGSIINLRRNIGYAIQGSVFQQYDTPGNILENPATDIVRKLISKERCISNLATIDLNQLIANK